MWVPLTSDTLLSRVSSAERDALAEAATDPTQTDVLGDLCAQVAHDWRSGVRRYCTLHSDRTYVPDELMSHILADLRYRAYTRLPGMAGLLDDLRVKEWELSTRVRSSLREWTFDAPETADQEAAATSGKPGPAISVPDAFSVL